MKLEEMKPHTNPRYQRDEIGIGNAFADYFKPIARLAGDRNIWYVYDGVVWHPDENALAVAELAKVLADRLYSFALQIKDEDTRNRYIKRVQKLQLRKHRKTMLEDAKSVHPVKVSMFDRNKYLFNCANGTLDLSTLEFHPHDPEDFITKVSPINYDADAICPRWNRFIDEIMQGNTAVSRYLQKAIGYTMIGDTSLECLFVMYGPTTRNGKTTTIETILRVMGEYGCSAKPDLLAANFRGPSSGGPSEDVARLAGARFVGISEMEQKLTINASLTKQLTGNSSITARFLNQNSFDFRMQAKIFIDTNHLPNVNDQTLFESGRIKIIPFNRHFEDQPDLTCAFVCRSGGEVLMDIARLKVRITIEKSTVKVDEIGNHTNGWEDYYSCYAYPNTYTVDETESKADYENQTIAFSVRACEKTKALTSIGFRVQFEGQVYNIVSIDKMNYDNKGYCWRKQQWEHSEGGNPSEQQNESGGN